MCSYRANEQPQQQQTKFTTTEFTGNRTRQDSRSTGVYQCCCQSTSCTHDQQCTSGHRTHGLLSENVGKKDALQDV